MIHTQTQIDNLIELAIIQRVELRKLVESLPELRTHLSVEIERNLNEIEPAMREELQAYLLTASQSEHAILGNSLKQKIAELAVSLEDTTAQKYSVLMNERAENDRLLMKAEARIAEAAIALPSAVKEIVLDELSRFPRANQIDQLRKEFAEPASLNPRGKWQIGETYNKLDLVSINGNSFIANETTTEKPTMNSTAWTLNSSKGGVGAGITSITELTGTPSNGETLIGNGQDYVKSTLTAGNGISITNGAGSITVTATGGVNFQGSWNASTNTPTLTSSVGTTGFFYIVSVAGSTNLNGVTDWEIGDWAIFGTSTWTKVDNTDKVSSVFGRVGSVVGVSTDYSAVGITNTALGASNPSTVAATTLSSSSTTILNGTTIPASKTLVVTTDKLSALAATTSAELAGVISDETGSGALVFATSPTLVTPALGTPSALVGTNITGTAAGLTAGNVSTNANLTGDVTSVGNATSIASGVIVNADVNASAAIAYSKLNLATSIVDADISASAAIVDTKLATISTASKVSNSATTAASANTASAIVARDASGNFIAGTITANLTGTASNVTTNANLTGDVTSVGNATSIAAGVIVNADISGSAAIVDTKLDTISSALKVSNSATTASALNTASAIVARDASGNFSAGTISADLTGNVTGNVSGSSGSTTGNAATATALATGRTIAITGDLAYTSPSFDGTANVTAAGTLATVATAGTTGGSTAIPVVTINAKGLTTSITTAAVIAPAGTLTGNTLASGVTASSLTSLGTIANLTATAGTISTTPSASTDIANKLYVDTVAQGLDAKGSCLAASTANITLSGTQTVDGIVLIAGDRVLVKDQTLSQNNGIYLCAAGAWTRTTDADTWDELTSAFTFIETGTVNADTGYVCTANAGGTLGTTALPWSQFSGAGSYTASTGLTLTGTVFSLTAPVTVALGGTNATSAGIAAFNNISGFTAAGATGTTSTNLVFSTSPTLITPDLGTPTALVGTNISGTAAGLTAGNVTTNANLTGVITSVGNTTSIASQTGTGSTFVVSGSPTITTPVIAQINDSSGNETLKLASIASAVNEISIENAATGNPVHIRASGGDASIGLHLVAKGASGYVNVTDGVDETKRLMFNASGGTTNTRTMLSSTQTVDRTLSLPDATDTLVGKATTDTLTNKTITGGILNGTLGATTPSTIAATTISANNGITNSGAGDQYITCASTSGAGSLIADSSGTNNSYLYFRNGGGANPRARLLADNSDVLYIQTGASNTTRATFTSTGLNSTAIGATTRSTGAFSSVGVGMTAIYAMDLTVGASDGIRLNASSGQCNIFLQQAGVTNGYINAAGGAGTDLNIYATRTLNLNGGTSGISMVGNTAVTGTLSATGTITASSSTNSGQIKLQGSNQNAIRLATSAGGSGLIIGRSLGSNDANDFFIYNEASSATMMTLSSTGAAITGTLSNTNTITVSGTSATGASQINLNASDYSSGPSYTSSILYQNGNSATGTTCGLANAGLGSLYFQNISNALIWTNSGVNMVFGTSSAERMRIDSNGNVGIGTTNPAGSYLAKFASVSTSASNYAGVFYVNAASSDSIAAVQMSKSTNVNTSSQVFSEFYINAFGTASGRIVANGASAAAFASYSDKRLKENITDLPSQLNNILSLRPVEFDFVDGSGHQIGFIAQEVEEIYPDLIAKGKDDMLTLTGLSKNEARLIKAIQEQNAQIVLLSARLAALEAK